MPIFLKRTTLEFIASDYWRYSARRASFLECFVKLFIITVLHIRFGLG